MISITFFASMNAALMREALQYEEHTGLILVISCTSPSHIEIIWIWSQFHHHFPETISNGHLGDQFFMSCHPWGPWGQTLDLSVFSQSRIFGPSGNLLQFANLKHGPLIIVLVRWLTALKDGDFPGRKLLVYQRVPNFDPPTHFFGANSSHSTRHAEDVKGFDGGVQRPMGHLDGGFGPDPALKESIGNSRK